YVRHTACLRHARPALIPLSNANPANMTGGNGAASGPCCGGAVIDAYREDIVVWFSGNTNWFTMLAPASLLNPNSFRVYVSGPTTNVELEKTLEGVRMSASRTGFPVVFGVK